MKGFNLDYRTFTFFKCELGDPSHPSHDMNKAFKNAFTIERWKLNVHAYKSGINTVRLIQYWNSYSVVLTATIYPLKKSSLPSWAQNKQLYFHNKSIVLYSMISTIEIETLLRYMSIRQQWCITNKCKIFTTRKITLN